MRHTAKDRLILRYLIEIEAAGKPFPTARQIHDEVSEADTVASWAGPSLTRMRLQGYVEPASPGRLRNVTWKATKDGHARLHARTHRPDHSNSKQS